MKRRKTARDEHGAVVVIAAIGMVLAMIAAALAVDLGTLAQVARRNQKVADLAAIDAVRALPNDPTGAALLSAKRNHNNQDWSGTGWALTVKWSDSVTGPLATAQVPGHSGMRSFSPPYTGATSQTIPGSTTVPLPALGAGNITVGLTGLGTTLATLGLTPSGVTTLIVNLVSPLVTPLNNTVVAPITRGLGLSLGAGDLWAPPPQNCNPTSFNTDPTSSVGPGTPNGYQVPSLVG
jgi:Flp pilus assembly protein TadG